MSAGGLEIEEFIQRGWTKLTAAIGPERLAAERRRLPDRVSPLSEALRHRSYSLPVTVRLATDSGWSLGKRHLEDIAPAAWRLVCALLGGESELADRRLATIDDGFVLNFPVTRPWKAASPEEFAWHLDGFGSKRHLASADIALVLYTLWSDVNPR